MQGMCVCLPHTEQQVPGVLDGWEELQPAKEKQICFLPFPDEDAEP